MTVPHPALASLLQHNQSERRCPHPRPCYGSPLPTQQNPTRHAGSGFLTCQSAGATAALLLVWAGCLLTNPSASSALLSPVLALDIVCVERKPSGFSEFLLAQWLVQVLHVPQGSPVTPQAPRDLSVSKHSRDDCHCFWSLMTCL